jgi:hypothetical protein
MESVIADEALKAFLAPFKERIAIRDENGKLIGYFAPACDLLSDLEKQMYEEIKKQIDPEEYFRRKERSKNGPFYTHEQVMERLRALELEEERRRQAEAAG